MLMLVVFKALPFVGGLIWCKEVFERRHDDMEVLREGADRMHQGLIVGFWVVTTLVAAGVAWMAFDAISDIVRGVRGL